MANIPNKICKMCGEPFKPNSCHQIYCKRPHSRICPICGKSYIETNVEKFKFPPTACSKECKVKRIQRTSMERYGILAPGNNPEAREKSKKTMNERYGVDYAQSSKDIKDKSISTWMNKYGVDNPQKSEIIKKKSNATKLRNLANKLHNKEYELKQTKINFLYNEFGIDLPDTVLLEARKNPQVMDNLRKIAQAKLISAYEKMRSKMFKKYGTYMVPEYIERNIDNDKTIHKSITKHPGKISSINRRINEKLHDVKINSSLELYIGKKSYDIYIPEGNILLEINPTCTHNTVMSPWSNEGLHRYYHLYKTILAEENRYRCIHLWDWDCESKFINLLTVKNIIYDKVNIELVEDEEAKKFIKKYSLYDITKNSINVIYVGARYKSKLICLIGFQLTDVILRHWNIICIEHRFNYNVYNGNNKILEYFVEKFAPNKITGYADYSKSNGELLENLGFANTRFILPNKIWSKGRHAIIDDNTIIEEAMINEGWLPVYNCGYKVYEKNV